MSGRKDTFQIVCTGAEGGSPAYERASVLLDLAFSPLSKRWGAGKFILSNVFKAGSLIEWEDNS